MRGKRKRSRIEDRSMSRNGIATTTVINLKGLRVINESISRDWFDGVGTDVSMAQIRPRKRRRFVYTRYAVQHGGKQSTFAEFNAEIVRDDGVCGQNRRRYQRVNADSRDNFASGIQ